MTLYELTEEWQNLLEEIEENQGILSEQLNDKLIKLTQASSAKVDNALDVLAQLDAQYEAQKAQTERMKRRAQRTEAIAEILRTRILHVVRGMGGLHESTRWRAKVSKSKPAIIPSTAIWNSLDSVIQFLEKNNPRFVKVETSKRLDKEELGKLNDTELDLLGFKRQQKEFLRIT